MHRFIAIGEIKLELQSGNTQFGSKSVIFCPMWPKIWHMTLTNYMAPLLSYFKLCAAFHRHQWIQTGVTVQKRPNWDKICADLCDLDLWPLTLIFCMAITLIIGNNYWKLYDDTMTGTLRKRHDMLMHWCYIFLALTHQYTGQVTKLRLSCYLVLISIDSKTR